MQRALARLVERTEPQLVVASGDLAHRGRREQLERAAELLRSLGPPVLAVPGNHDLPYTPARLVRPWAEFERIWETKPGLYGWISTVALADSGGNRSGVAPSRGANSSLNIRQMSSSELFTIRRVCLSQSTGTVHRPRKFASLAR